MRKQFKVVEKQPIGHVYLWEGDFDDFLAWYKEVKDSKRDGFIYYFKSDNLVITEKTSNSPKKDVAAFGDYIVKFPGMYLTVYSEEDFENQLLILE